MGVYALIITNKTHDILYSKYINERSIADRQLFEMTLFKQTKIPPIGSTVLWTNILDTCVVYQAVDDCVMFVCGRENMLDEIACSELLQSIISLLKEEWLEQRGWTVHRMCDMVHYGKLCVLLDEMVPVDGVCDGHPHDGVIRMARLK